MSLLETLLAQLQRLIQPLVDRLLRPIQPLVTIFGHLRENTIGIFSAATVLIKTTESTYEKIVHFTTLPAFKTRVISVPKVSENVKELVSTPQRLIAAFKDLFEQIRSKVQPEKFNIDELEGIEDLRSVFTRFGARLAAGLEKILGVAAIIVDALVTIRQGISDLQEIVDSVAAAVSFLSNLDGVFLQQGNPRVTLTLEDGSTIRKRVP